MKALGAVLRGVRGFRKLRVAQVAREVGVTDTTINSIENGVIPSIPTLLKVCKWMGIQPSAFLDADDSDLPAPAPEKMPEDEFKAPAANGSMFGGLSAGAVEF